MLATQTLAEAFGLKKDTSISLTHISGSHNGQTFTGKLTCDVEVSQSIFIDDGMDITDGVISIEEQKDKTLLVKTTGEECVIKFE